MTPTGFPHSEIFGSKLSQQLPEAYRSFIRPSSVSYVKASIMCAYVTFYVQSFSKKTSMHLTSYWLLPITCRLS